MPEMSILERRNWTKQEPDQNPDTTTIASTANQGLVYSSPLNPSGHSSGTGSSGRGSSWRLSPPADSPSSCWGTSTSKLFLASSVLHLWNWSRFRGHEISLHNTVRWWRNKFHQLKASTIAKPITTMHLSLNYIITTHPWVLSYW